MRTSCHQISLWSAALLLLLASNPFLHAQERIEIRAGQGWSITSPGLRSIFLSVPHQRLDEVNSHLSINLNQTVTMLQRQRELEFIVGVTPVILLELAKEFPRIGIEAGVGANIISTKEIDGRQLGSNFLFSPTVSVGIEVPWLNNVVGVSYMFRHLSNAGFFEDNDGVNFQYIIFSMTFRLY